MLRIFTCIIKLCFNEPVVGQIRITIKSCYLNFEIQQVFGELSKPPYYRRVFRKRGNSSFMKIDDDSQQNEPVEAVLNWLVEEDYP